MVSFRAWQIVVLSAFLSAAPAFARTHRAATSGHAVHHRSRHHKPVVRGQREIEPERALEIQNALIRAHYMTAPASGQWDDATEAAMQKFQADHGWQTKLTPDARALIKLGLGPQNDGSDGGTLVGASGVTGDKPAAAFVPGVPAADPAPANTLASDHPSRN